MSGMAAHERIPKKPVPQSATQWPTPNVTEHQFIRAAISCTRQRGEATQRPPIECQGMSGDVTLRSGSPYLVAAATRPAGLPDNKQIGLIHNSATHLTLTCHKILPLVQQGTTPQGTSMQPA